MSIQEAATYADAEVALAGGAMSHIFMHPHRFRELQDSLAGKVTYTTLGKGDLAFSGFELPSQSGGTCKVFTDPNCPNRYSYGLQLDTWCLLSVGENVKIDDADGNVILRKASSADYEVRVLSLAELVCEAPGWNIQIDHGV